MIDTPNDLLRAIAALDPPVFLFGGVAEDAVLDGALTRPHGDVDVMIPRHELDRRLEQFAAWGYDEWETWLTSSRGQPQVLHSSGQPAELEISVVEGEPGEYWFEFENPAGGYLKFYLPSQAFNGPRVDIDDVSVHTFTARTLYLVRAALTAAGSFGPPRDKDLEVQPRLRALLGDVADDDLVPDLRG